MVEAMLKMDRPVKERLVGATILLAMIVLIVPELLSGPKTARPPVQPLTVNLPAPTRSVSVDLATSKATAEPPVAPASAPPIEAAGDSASASESDEPAPAIAPPLTPPATPRPVTPSTEMAPRPAPVAAAAPAAPSTAAARHGWAVQLGSFKDKANADKLVHQLKARGTPVYVASSGTGGSLRYKVRVGPMADKDSAERTAAKLKAEGHTTAVVNAAS
jgi:DedD protein